MATKFYQKMTTIYSEPPRRVLRWFWIDETCKWGIPAGPFETMNEANDDHKLTRKRKAEFDALLATLIA